MIKELLPMLTDFKSELKKYVGKNIHRCPLCEKIFEWDDYYYNPEDSIYTCPCCLTDFDESQLLDVNASELFEDMFLAYKERNQVYKEENYEHN
ncbi:MAG: hypothetical protein IJZ29_01290 [Clostridia bacterium]|nr:hypothetical protein [Clostridia bacterium]